MCLQLADDSSQIFHIFLHFFIDNCLVLDGLRTLCKSQGTESLALTAVILVNMNIFLK